MNDVFYDIKNNPFTENGYQGKPLTPNKLSFYDDLINSPDNIEDKQLLQEIKTKETDSDEAYNVLATIKEIRAKRKDTVTLIDILKQLIDKYNFYKTQTESFIGN